MWPKADHGFFMHPPLLKSTAGRRKETRYKGYNEGGKGNKGRHQCPICHEFGHHWGPPKRKKKQVLPASIETSIVPVLAPRMVFPDLGLTPPTRKRIKKQKKRWQDMGRKIRDSQKPLDLLEWELEAKQVAVAVLPWELETNGSSMRYWALGSGVKRETAPRFGAKTRAHGLPPVARNGRANFFSTDQTRGTMPCSRLLELQLPLLRLLPGAGVAFCVVHAKPKPSHAPPLLSAFFFLSLRGLWQLACHIYTSSCHHRQPVATALILLQQQLLLCGVIADGTRRDAACLRWGAPADLVAGTGSGPAAFGRQPLPLPLPASGTSGMGKDVERVAGSSVQIYGFLGSSSCEVKRTLDWMPGGRNGARGTIALSLLRVDEACGHY
ncbi:hypothetical protein U9M48_002514 [Paspalum notatum var. saurae]|uniref:Uncharacterized protein n=1 Tax=Paspalum notatum var. saurae TaxID=547442 RepID=A0AAQ3SHI2_PASNO